MELDRSENRAPTFASRRKAAIDLLQTQNADLLFVAHPPHIRYLTGFSGSTAYLLLHRESPAILLTDFRYREQAHEEFEGTKASVVRIVEKDYTLSLLGLLKELHVARLVFDPKYLTCDLFSKIRQKQPAVDLTPVPNACESLCRKKDDWEIDRIARACAISDDLFRMVLQLPLTNLSEKAIAAEMEYEGRKRGSEGASFPSIIAGGANAAKPHAPTGTRMPQTGEMLLLDYGQIWSGYCSDMTRTISLGKPDAKLREIYEIVLQAQKKALSIIGPGRSCAEVDAAARDFIRQAGYGESFGHSLGHGIGIEVHESPRLSTTSTEILEPGMVVSVEPGIYLPGWGGVRIEDLVAITSTGFRNLASAEKSLIAWPV